MTRRPPRRRTEDVNVCETYALGHKYHAAGASPYVGLVYHRCEWCRDLVLWAPTEKKRQ